MSSTLRNKGKEKEHYLESDTTGRFSDNENNPLQSDEDSNEHSGLNNDLTENVTIADIENDFGDASGDLMGPADEMDNEDSLEEESPSIVASDARKVPKQNPAAKNKESDVVRKGPENVLSSSPKRKRPGRPPKAQSNLDQVEADQRPKKKAKAARAEPPHATLQSDPELDKVVENYTNRTGPLKGRSLYILKREIPSDERTTHTRSGRVSVRPLAYWRNERCVYGDGEANIGQRFPLSTIKEIIRTEELQPDTAKAGKRKSHKKSKSRKARDERSDDEDGDEEDADEWERESGVLHGYIRKWDPETQAGTTEEEVLGMLPNVIFHNKLLNCDPIHRHCLCSFGNRDSRCQGLDVPLRKATEFALYRFWNC
jgi:centromere protein C